MRSAVRGRDDGQVLVLFALAVFGMVALLALIVDGGFLYVQRRTAQAAADAAALAGARALRDACQPPAGCTTAGIASAAASAAQANAFGTLPSVQCVYLVDTSGAASLGTLSAASGASCPSGWPTTLANASGVHVDVRITYPSILAGMLRISSFNADAHATAQLGAPSTVDPLDAPLIVCGGGLDGVAMRVSNTPAVTVTSTGYVVPPTGSLPTYNVTASHGYTLEQFLLSGTNAIDPAMNGHVYYIKGSSIGVWDDTHTHSSACGADSNTFDGGADMTGPPIVLPGAMGGIHGNSVSAISTQVQAPGGCVAGTDITQWTEGGPGCVMLLPVANDHVDSTTLKVQTMAAFYVYCNQSSSGASGNCQEWLGQLIASVDVASPNVINVALNGTNGPTGPVVVRLTQ